MKDNIKVTNSNEERFQYEVVTIYTVKDAKYNYIIYKDEDNEHFYIAKFTGRKKVDLITALRESEIKVGNIILKEILGKTVEVNKDHKRANLSNINSLRNELSINLTGSTINLFLLSGSAKPEPEKEIELPEEKPSKTIDIIDWYASEIRKSIGLSSNSPITEETLKRVYTLDLRISTSGDLSFLCKCLNLRILTLNIYNNSGNLNSIKSLKELEELNINFIFNNGDINTHDFKFIINSPKIKKVSIIGAKKISNDILNNIEDLVIQQDGLLNYKYKNLNNLSELDFVRSSPYDIGISLTNNILQEMRSKRVKLSFSTPEDLIKIDTINAKIDKIMEDNSIKPNGNKNSILNKIIKYTLDNITYQSTRTNDYGLIYNPLENHIGTSEEIEAFIIALINRTNINTETLYDYKRDWIKVRYNNEDYYFDSTWKDNKYFSLTIEDKPKEEIKPQEDKKVLNDELIRAGVDTNLEWFKNIPREVEKEEDELPKKDFLDLANKIIKLNFDNQIYSIDPGMLIAILDTIGLSINYLMNASDIESIKKYITEE